MKVEHEEDLASWLDHSVTRRVRLTEDKLKVIMRIKVRRDGGSKSEEEKTKHTAIYKVAPPPFINFSSVFVPKDKDHLMVTS